MDLKKDVQESLDKARNFVYEGVEQILSRNPDEASVYLRALAQRRLQLLLCSLLEEDLSSLSSEVYSG